MSSAVQAAIACPKCATPLAPTLRVCPSCHSLVYGEQLTWLAQHAGIAEKQGDVAEALASWRRALDLLPEGTKQHAQVVARIESLTPRLSEQPSPVARGRRKTGPIAAIVTTVVVLLSKAKFLLLGLTKLPALLSMLVYAQLAFRTYGWKLGLLVLLSLYVHELGHVAAFRRIGIAASAPMFVPGFGAYVRGAHRPASPSEQAFVSLAGPWWGLGAAAIFAGFGLVGQSPLFLAAGKYGALLNLLNLIPLGIPGLVNLDGVGGIAPLSRGGRLVLAGVCAATALATWNFAPAAVSAAVLFHAISTRGPASTDRQALASFAVSVVLLAAVAAAPMQASP